MGRDKSWTASLWVLEDNDRKIGEFSLPVVPWLRLTDPLRFWPVERKASYRPGPSGSSGSGGTTVSVLSKPPVDLCPILDKGYEGGCDGEDDESLWKAAEDELEALLEQLRTSTEELTGAGSVGCAGRPASGSSAPAEGPVVAEAGVEPPPAPHVEERKPKAKAKASDKRKYDKITVCDEDGTVIGFFLLNYNAQSFDIHCRLHDGDCAISKTFKPYDGEISTATGLRLAKGRPLAFLVAWLRWGKRFTGEDGRAEHMAARFCRGPDAELGDGSSALRLNARAYVEREDDFAVLRREERQPRTGEPIEPPARL